MPKVSYALKLPPVPKDENDIPGWAEEISNVLTAMHRILVRGLNNIALQGDDADKPTATGSRRFYWAEDTSTLYYDDGAWSAV